MKKQILLGFSFTIIILFCQIELFAFQNDPTTILLVRHAERAEDGTNDPPISIEGKIRAEHLYKIISKYSIQAIYSTPYKRTKMTAKPTADSLGLEIQEYNFREIEEFLTKIIKNNTGNAVLIIGHSNTTPNLVNNLIGEEKYEQFEETEYGDLFIVRITELGKGRVELSKF